MPIMSYQTFNLPGIPADLRREETVYQIVDSLDYLEKIANEIFQRISARVSENGQRLKKINDRVNLAEARINKIKGSKKATKVFASAKYPAPDNVEDYGNIYKDNKLKNPKRPHYKAQSKPQVVDDNVLRQKLQFYNVHLNLKRKKQEDDKEEGLGGLPQTVPSVSSLLLFNTSENPYKKYVMLDPLGVVTKTRTAIEEEEAGLADAPSTIAQREEMQRLQAENYFYIPDIGTVPELVVPEFLPNLLGVADDLMYSADQSPSIAPSVFGSNIPDLPAVVEEEGAPVITNVPLPEVVSAPPPPPPPPAPDGPAPGGPPPPPPPVPPEAPPPPPPPPPSTDVTGAPSDVVQPSDGRASLLDSIRKAGGAGKAKLKNAKDRKMEHKKKKKEEKTGGSSGGGSSGGDLMSDLFTKLSMRRIGISGTKSGGGGEKSDTSSSSGGGSAMDKISAMIPAPPASGDTGGDDDNWED